MVADLLQAQNVSLPRPVWHLLSQGREVAGMDDGEAAELGGELMHSFICRRVSSQIGWFMLARLEVGVGGGGW